MKQLIAAVVFLSLFSGSAAWGQGPFAAGVRPTDPLSPGQQQKTFQLPPGFEIQLFASEPDIFKPLNMAFDARGRLWVTSTQEYPYPAKDRKGRDSIKILEDTNGDGRADKIINFADDLNIPIGIHPYDDGAIVYSIPYIWRLRDTDGDGRADQREKLFGPMGFERDTHGMNNSFRRGFDGWLYACHGFNNITTVKGTDGHEIQMSSGNTYRMRLDGSRIEHFTWGQVNPFGMALDPLGNIFTADCHSKPVYQLLRGGYYPSFGKPDDGLGFVQPMMDHLHGSTAIAGVAFYTGENFPPQFHGNLFSGNVMTSRVNRNSLIYDGSTITAKEEPDFVIAKDPWFRPVDVRIGPDGAMYIADFYNRIIGHYEVPLDHPGRDRKSGRIWRIVYTGGGKKSPPLARGTDLSQADAKELIAALDDEVLTRRNLATDQLTDRLGVSAAGEVAKAFEKSKSPKLKSHALWVLHRLGVLDEGRLKAAANDGSAMVRVHAMKALSEAADWTSVKRQMALTGLSDSDAFVRRAAADALGQHPQFENIGPLFEALRTASEKDNHLRHVVRMALRDQIKAAGAFDRLEESKLSEAEAREIASVSISIKTPAAGSFLARHVRQTRQEKDVLSRYLRHAARYAPRGDADTLSEFARRHFAKDLDFQWSLLSSISDGLAQRGLKMTPTIKNWGAELSRALLDSVEEGELAWVNIPMADKRDKTNPWVLQKRRSADGGEMALFLCSLPRGERLTGVLRSRNFEIPEKLGFYSAGHIGFPGKPLNPKNFIRLRDARTHRILAEATPPRNDTAREYQWDLKKQAGGQGYLEIVDGDDAGAFAWLAVGRFEPAIAPLPRFNPSLIAQRRQAAADIAARLKQTELKEQLKAIMASKSSEPGTKEAVARALAAFDPDSGLAALAPIVGDLTASEELRDKVSQVFSSGDNKLILQTLAEALRTAPQRLQTTLALTLAGDKRGAEILLNLVQQGHASPRLLQNQAILQRLTTVGLKNDQQRISKLTAGLPSENETLLTLIQSRSKAFPKARTSLEKGAQVFTKNCAICHQLEGKGAVVGPQLDGIGNRGMERLLEDVLDPNRNVDAAFRTLSIQTVEGKVVSGLLRREEGALLILADDKGKEFSIAKSEIEEQAKSSLSLMPENVAQILTEQDFYDLVAYLLTKRGPALKPDVEK